MGRRRPFPSAATWSQPGKTLEIEGFRTSTNTVAAFEFSSVSNSYANLRHGNTRNVGVIGIAVFTQKGVNPWTWMPDEVKQRNYGESVRDGSVKIGDLRSRLQGVILA